MYRNRLIAGIALGLVLSVSALGAEKKIKQSKLPPAVQQTAEAQSAGATVSGYTINKVDDVATYRMNLVAEGLARTVVMDSEGSVLSVEQEVGWNDLPVAVQKDFENATSKGKLGAVSTVTTNGTLVAYEAYLITGGERAKVRVKPKAAELAPMPSPGSSK